MRQFWHYITLCILSPTQWIAMCIETFDAFTGGNWSIVCSGYGYTEMFVKFIIVSHILLKYIYLQRIPLVYECWIKYRNKRMHYNYMHTLFKKLFSSLHAIAVN